MPFKIIINHCKYFIWKSYWIEPYCKNFLRTTTSATNQTMKISEDAKQVTICFLKCSFHPSFDDISLQIGESEATPHLYHWPENCAQCSKAAPAGAFFFLFLYKIWKQNQEKPPASPSTLLGTYHFHTLQYKTVYFGSSTVPKIQWTAPYWVNCINIHNLLSELPFLETQQYV